MYDIKKTALASAIALVITGGVATSAQANTSGLTGVWSGTYLFNMSSPFGNAVGGTVVPQNWTWDFDAGVISVANTAGFYGSVWTAKDIAFSDDGSSYSAALLFDWSSSLNIPVQQTWDVDATGNAVSNTAVVTSLTGLILPSSPAFPNFQPQFSGTLHKDVGTVPVPAAAWLMGSGLLGLAGVARRRRKS